MQEIIDKAMAPWSGSVAVEIGCGGGCWTRKLAALNGRVYAVDTVPLPFRFVENGSASNVEYFQVEDDGKLPFIADESVAFVWSHDVFCHFPFSLSQAYLRTIRRILVPGGRAVIMFPCNERHPDRRNQPLLPRNEPDEHLWFDTSLDDIKEMAAAASLVVADHDLFPANRDRFVLFTHL